MPFSSGVFSRLYSWATEQLSSPIEISKLDTQEEDFATAFNNCILRDGTGKPSADQDWNGQDLTNVAALGVTGAATFTKFGSGTDAAITVSAAIPAVALKATDQATDEKLWDFAVSSKIFLGRALNDGATLGDNWVSVERSTYSVTRVSLGGAAGVVRMPQRSGDPASASNGDMYYNTTTHKFRGYANGSWVDLH